MSDTITITLPNGTTITCRPDQVGDILRQAAPSVPHWAPIGIVPPREYPVVPLGYFDPTYTPIC